jgi:hypothetical protein
MDARFDPPSRNWWQRNWKWCVPVLCGSLLALLIAGVFALALGVMQIMRSSTPYQEAVGMAKADPAVVQALGTPVEAGWFNSGKIETHNGSGHADLQIPLQGPKGKARLYVVADKRGKHWRYETLEVQVDGSDAVIALDKHEP